MVNYYVYAGCANSSLTRHYVHHLPGRLSKSFWACVRFVQVTRVDFTAASVMIHSEHSMSVSFSKSRYAIICTLYDA